MIYCINKIKMTVLNLDVIKKVLSYNDDLRILKIKMNEQNIKYLFENIKELQNYLYEMNSSYDVCIGESIYLDLISLLSDEKNTMENVKNKLYSQYNLYLNKNDEYYKFIIYKIMKHYNEYYLNDNYYYNGYWYDNMWYKNGEEPEIYYASSDNS